VDEFPHVGEDELLRAMPILEKGGVPLIVHAELEDDRKPHGDPRAYRTYLDSRPRYWENRAIQLMIRLARQTRCQTHIVHLSSCEALEDIARAQRDGVPITAETCPHYLYFTAEEIAAGATQFKCAPPIREKENRERLWQGVREGLIEFIVSDHSPCVPKLKLLEQGDFTRAWGGIAGLQFTLPVIWTQMRERGFSLNDLARLMASNTARFVGLSSRKGAIAPGRDADLVIWNPDSRFTLEPSQVRHRHSLTPYAGRELYGEIEMTFLRGRPAFDAMSSPGPALGQPLYRTEKAA
jgi:allantoinase